MTPGLILLVVLAVTVFVGLVVDTAGVHAAEQQAAFAANSAARAATGGLSGDINTASTGALQSIQAANLANQYLNAAGLDGNVAIAGPTVTVIVDDTYQPVFLSLFGIGPIDVQGTGSAQLIAGE